jgi:hemoglobin
MSQPTSFYESVGGEEFFRRLVHRFYQGVVDDPVLRPVYPAKDLGPAEEHLALFLMQYWGGPRTYDELRGHPRLRMRHVRFAIGEAERDAWLHQMRVALDGLSPDPGLEVQLWDYLVMAAHSLINVEPARGHGDLGLTANLGAQSGDVVEMVNRVVDEVPGEGLHGERGPVAAAAGAQPFAAGHALEAVRDDLG